MVRCTFAALQTIGCVDQQASKVPAFVPPSTEQLCGFVCKVAQSYSCGHNIHVGEKTAHDSGIMQKAGAQSVKSPVHAPPAPKKVHSGPLEPEPEFSRNVTEDVRQEMPTVYIKESKTIGPWQNPALAASMALAITSTFIAARKSL